MKKIIKTLSLILVTICLATSFVACSKNNKSQEQYQINPESVTDTTIQEPETTPETDDETEATPEQPVISNGIYVFTQPATLKDVWFENVDEAIEFFETRDINGIDNELVKRGFYDFATSQIEFQGIKNKYAFKIVDNNVYTTLIYEYKPSSYWYKDYTKSTISETFYKIEQIEEGLLKVDIQFTYKQDEKLIKTPAFVTRILKLVDNSDSIFNTKDYIYKNNSAKLLFDSNSQTNNEEAINKLAFMFNIPETSVDKLSDIINIIKIFNYKFSSNFSILTIEDNINNAYLFNAVNNNFFTFNFGGNKIISFKLLNRHLDATTKVEEVMFSIYVDENTEFVFTCVAK